MIISNSSSLSTQARAQNAPPPAETTPPPADGFQPTPEAPGVMTKVGRAAIQGGSAGSGLMIATFAGQALRHVAGGFLGPVVAAGIGAVAGAVVATKHAQHKGIPQSENTSGILIGAATGAALGVASSFPGTMVYAWGAGAVAGGASEFF